MSRLVRRLQQTILQQLLDLSKQLTYHCKDLLVAELIAKTPMQKLFKCKRYSTKRTLSCVLSATRQYVFVLGLSSSCEALFFASRKLVSFSFHRAPSHCVLSCHRKKEATKDADRSRACWLTWLRTAVTFALLTEFLKIRHLRLAKRKTFPTIRYSWKSNNKWADSAQRNFIGHRRSIFDWSVLKGLKCCWASTEIEVGRW